MRCLATLFLWFFLAILSLPPAVATAGPDNLSQFLDRSDARYSSVLTSSEVGPQSARQDSIVLLGGTLGNGDFQDAEGAPSEDGWSHVDLSGGAGDFAQVWALLWDIDPARTNDTPQFAFIDDGAVVPGTGGYLCTTWCYGPSGWVVNPEGGLLGPDHGITNEIWSPAIDWTQTGYDSAHLAYDVYVHLPHTFVNPDIYYYWKIRSVDTGDPADLATASWRTDGQLYFGIRPEYLRFAADVSPYLEPGRTHAQVALGVMDLNIVPGTDATPSPYFDNVRLVAHEISGPAMAVREGHLAQHAFPESGVIDYGSLGANNVRFDMARNISPPEHLRNDPGDSLVCDITAVRTGSVLLALPKLHYKLRPNPLFDPYRTSGLPNEGWVYGDTCRTDAGVSIENRYCFDLPDSGFLYPGDEVHYYFSAEDDLGGVSHLPADTTGYANFTGDPQYDSAYVVRALPTLFSPAEGAQPAILFIQDSPERDGENEWDFALRNLGYRRSVDYDFYWVNEPAAGLGNGIGGRATSLQLAYYEMVLYTCGDASVFTLSNGDFDFDAGDDIGVLDSWLQLGDKSMLLAGDNLCSNLAQSGAMALAFLQNWLSVNYIQDDLQPLISNQRTPGVMSLPGNSVFFQVDQWRLVSSNALPLFDAIVVTGTAERLAEFTDPAGNPGAYSYAAATLHIEPAANAKVITLPYDLAWVAHPAAAKAPVPSATRTQMLEDILVFCGHVGSGPYGVPDLDLSTAVSAATEPVSVFTLPDAAGFGLDHAFAYGGTVTDATITVTLVDATLQPVVNYPAEDIWLQTTSGGLQVCPGGSVADGDTDANGQTAFKQPVAGGGQAYPGADETLVLVSGEPLNQPPLAIHFNSTDLTGDLVVSITDATAFATDYGGSYNYRSDFHWDGVLDVSDLTLFGLGSSRHCPPGQGVLLVPPDNDPLPAATMGVYFDLEGTEQIKFIEPFVPFDAYVLLSPESSTDLGGAAWTLPIHPAILVLSSDGGIDVGDLRTGIEVGVSECRTASPGNPGRFITIQLMLTDIVSDILTPEAHPDYPGLLYTDCGGKQSYDLTATMAYINPPQLGTIVVDPEPNILEAPWTLVGDLGFTLSSNGDTTLTDMVPDTYTLTWGAVGGWIAPSPNPEAATLEVGGTITFSGTYVSPLPNLLSIVDVPNDQGRNLRLSWERSPFDEQDNPPEITGYGVYRRQDAYLPKHTAGGFAGPQGAAASTDLLPAVVTEALKGRAVNTDARKLDGWDFLVMVPAHGDSIYHYVAPTLCDSTDSGICWSVFFLRTLTADPFTFWDSPPDSGYSIDNLVPGVPANFLVTYDADGNSLAWDENPDPDIQHYNVYRADRADCQFPGGEPVVSVPSTSWTDDLNGLPGSAWDYCYFVTAVDINGNESEPTEWEATQTTGVEELPIPTAFALHPCYPNPFNPATTIRFDLPQSARVELEIYDVGGRLVHRLVASEVFPAGRHEVLWRGQDTDDRPAAAGVYFYRLLAGPYSDTRRMTLVK